jgi:hypothetical protein
MKFINLGWKKLKARFKYRLFLLSASYILGKIGLFISPYYLNQEEMSDKLKINIDPSIGPVILDFLSPAEIENIFKHPETKELVMIKDALAKDNTLCAAFKHNGETMAFVFVNLTCCRSIFASFILKDNEAYLFSQYTYYNYRGKNLAPYLRYELYRRLLSMGRTRFYSITEYLNTPALVFKNKLNAKPLKLGLYVKLFNRYEHNFTLKNYIPLAS